ncbi:MAG: hypothetical protein HUK09_02180 [Bacteroidaceae bacterium]|nr:hypothetical protein [Bacteroidaceae bacterium]
MSLVYLNRHTSCPLYIGNTPLGFGLLEVEAGFSGRFNPYLSTILFVLEGQMQVSGPELGNYKLRAGEMIIVPLGAEHSVTAPQASRAIRLYLIGDRLKFCGRVISDDIVEPLARRTSRLSVLPIIPILDQFLQLIATYIRDGMLCCDIHELKQKELASLLQAYYLKTPLSRFLAPLYFQKSTFTERVVEMAAEFLTVEEMAERMQMPRSEFVHLFSLHFHEPHGKWLLRNKARALYNVLTREQRPLVEVAELLRFSSQQHMSTFCRNNLGCTPVQVVEGYMTDQIRALLAADSYGDI